MRRVFHLDAFPVHNRVLLALIVIAALVTLSAGFVSQAPNRLVSGNSIMLWQAVAPASVGGIAALGLLLLIAGFRSESRRLHQLVIAAAAALFLLVLHAAGGSAQHLAATGALAARTSLGAAFWALCLCTLLMITDGMQRLRAGPASSLALAGAMAAAIFAMAADGQFNALSIMREYAARRDAFDAELGRHCLLVVSSVVPALLIGVPLGLLAARRASTRAGIFATLNLLQTIPSVALFGLLIAPLSALAQAVPPLAAIGLHGIGFAPAVIALALYALLPVARNTEAGIAAVDAAVIETADGMGFTALQRFLRVELPLALPTFLAGLRIVLVQAIGLAVVAALIGAGGLGSFVFQGLGQYAVDLVLLGAVPAILLALAVDFGMRMVIMMIRRRSLP